MIIDIHQHLNFWGRTNEEMINHQKNMGVELTVLLPSDGVDDLLAYVTGVEKAYQFTLTHNDFLFAANAPRTDPNLQNNLAHYIEKGAVLIGELKFDAPGNSDYLLPYIEVAQQYDVPILLHFQHKRGFGLSKFEIMLRKFPEVNFIGHATDFWKHMEDITDILMTKYSNFYGDMSASSCWAALQRDHASQFIFKHQDKLLFGTDCQDPAKPSQRYGTRCLGYESLNMIKQLATEDIREKIFTLNAKKLLKIGNTHEY